MDMNIKADETQLLGSWTMVGGCMVEDEVSKRIKLLTREYLSPLASSSGGWDKLFRDPSDGRFWELRYPVSSTHGGGPPALSVIDEVAARSKYKF
jgi:hypothetical protein